jgi:hypothetical protein
MKEKRERKKKIIIEKRKIKERKSKEITKLKKCLQFT